MSELEKIRERRKAIKAERAALDKEDSELDVAEMVITRLGGGGVSIARRIPLAKKPESQKDYIIETLRTLQDPWAESSTWLREEIKRQWGKDIPVSSFQPMIWQLTRKEKLIKREGLKLALSSRVD